MVKKQLYRSDDQRLIVGVCSGLSDYFKIDINLIRLIFIVLSLINGLGLVLYLILAIVIPHRDRPQAGPRENLNELAQVIQKKLRHAVNFSTDHHPNRFKLWIGSILIVWGLLLLAKKLAPTSLAWLNWGLLVPILIVSWGLYLIVKR